MKLSILLALGLFMSIVSSSNNEISPNPRKRELSRGESQQGGQEQEQLEGGHKKQKNETTEKEGLIKETEELIEKHVKLMEETEELIEKKKKLKNETKELIEKKKMLIKETEELIEKKKMLIKEKETEELIEKKNMLVKEKEELIEKKNMLVKEKEELGGEEEKRKQAVADEELKLYLPRHYPQLFVGIPAKIKDMNYKDGVNAILSIVFENWLQFANNKLESQAPSVMLKGFAMLYKTVLDPKKLLEHIVEQEKKGFKFTEDHSFTFGNYSNHIAEEIATMLREKNDTAIVNGLEEAFGDYKDELKVFIQDIKDLRTWSSSLKSLYNFERTIENRLKREKKSRY